MVHVRYTVSYYRMNIVCIAYLLGAFCVEHGIVGLRGLIGAHAGVGAWHSRRSSKLPGAYSEHDHDLSRIL